MRWCSSSRQLTIPFPEVDSGSRRVHRAAARRRGPRPLDASPSPAPRPAVALPVALRVERLGSELCREERRGSIAAELFGVGALFAVFVLLAVLA